MWLVLLLVSILGFFITREINTHDKAHSDLAQVVGELRREVHELHVVQEGHQAVLARIQDSLSRIDSRINAHLKQEERK